MDRQLLRHHIKWAEAADGPELFPYKDSVGVLTIGYGRNLDDKGIHRGEAELMLDNDIQDALDDCVRLSYWDKLSPVRKIVIADMVYNLGVTRFLRFKNLNKALQKRDWILAAHEMRDSKWYRQVVRRASVLHKAMLTGLWG